MPNCIRCKEPRADRPNGQSTSGGIVSESIGEIKQSELTGQPTKEIKTTAKAADRAAARKAAEAESDKEIQQQRELAAEFLVEGKQEAQEFIARMFYGYEGDAFKLGNEQQSKLCRAWAKLAKALNWQFDATWMAIGTVVVLETKTTMQQWAQMRAQMRAEMEAAQKTAERVQ